MAKLVADAVLDAALQYLEDNVDWISVCEGAPTTYEHAHSNKGTGAGKALAHSATPTFTGPADDTSGRKTTVDEEAANTIDVSGTADHIALCDISASALLYVTTCTSQALTAGNTVTIPAWKISIADPT
ncbi:MAG: hypothetical protein CVU54_01920 [Deltaproteobacteria bacterium HGW-Deltaproteobacteria-12]|jgi:hypothetical protein|nr:MAG: hypothetical protein CVU54_01920 [Deltaproteobacteria bacterium HGW-Deltaproteobacteria-12]